MTLDEALLSLNDRLGQEVTAWIEIAHDTPLLVATGTLENGDHEPRGAGGGTDAAHVDLRGRYTVADARFDLSDAPVELVSERENGLTFRIEGGVRLVVTWAPLIEGDLV